MPDRRGRATRQPRLLLATALAALVSLLASPVVATVEDLDAELEAAEERAATAEAELQQLEGEALAARDELVAIQGRLDAAAARLRTLEGQVALASRELEDREERAAAAAEAADVAMDEFHATEAELAAQEGVLGDQLAYAWIHGSTSGPQLMYDLLQDADSPSTLAADLYRLETVLDTQVGVVDEVTRLRTLAARALTDAERAEEAAEVARRLAAEGLAQVEVIRDEAAAVRNAVASDRDRQAAVLAALEQDAGQLEAVLASVAAEQERLQAERASVLAEEAAQREREQQERERQEQQRQEQERQEQGDGDGGQGAPPAPPPAGGGTTGSGPCPVVGAVAEQDFTNDWGHPRSGGRSHEGTDIFADRGTPVVALEAGTVKAVRTTDSGLGGLYVSLTVGPDEYWYHAHLDQVSPGIAVGAPVAKGQQLGTVGTSGNARGTPPHLHIGWYVSGGARNPYPVLADRCR